MRPLGLSDTIFYNLRDAQITAVAALDGPCDLPRLIAGLEVATAALPAFTETPVRLGAWSFARRPAPVDPARHIFVVRDPTVTGVRQLTPLLDRLRRNRIAISGPQWRIFVLNPAGGGSAPGALSAIFGQLRHGLADGTRTLQVLAKASGHEPTAAHEALAERLPAASFDDLTPNVTVHDVGPITASIPRLRMARDGDASTALAEAVRSLVEDRKLFPHAHPLRGNIGRTRFVLRRAGGGGAGNHVHMDTLTRQPAVAAKPAMANPGLSRAQDLPLSQWAVAVAPPPLARLMMKVWYRSFDGIATLIPLPRRLQFGGRWPTALYAAPPLWGPVPLVVLAFADAAHYHLSIYPGIGFTGDPTDLVDALKRRLTQGTMVSRTSPVG
jgi:hypothetical protein